MSTLLHKQVKSQNQHLKILWGRGARANIWNLRPTAQKNKSPPLPLKQANLKSKLPRGGEFDFLHWNMVCSSILSHK